jgi:hypothetical protein
VVDLGNADKDAAVKYDDTLAELKTDYAKIVNEQKPADAKEYSISFQLDETGDKGTLPTTITNVKADENKTFSLTKVGSGSVTVTAVSGTFTADTSNSNVEGLVVLDATTNKYMIQNVKSDIVVTVKFTNTGAKLVKDGTDFAAGTVVKVNGTNTTLQVIGSTGSDNVKVGDVINIKAPAASDNEHEVQVTVTNNSSVTVDTTPQADGSVEFTVPTGVTSLTVKVQEVAKDTVTATIASDTYANYAVDNHVTSGNTTVLKGKDVTLSISAKSGYVITSVTYQVNSAGPQKALTANAQGKYVIPADQVTNNIVVTVNTRAATHTVTLTDTNTVAVAYANDEAIVSGSGSLTIDDNGSVTITAAKAVKVTVTGTAGDYTLDTANNANVGTSVTVSNIIGAITITVADPS